VSKTAPHVTFVLISLLCSPHVPHEHSQLANSTTIIRTEYLLVDIIGPQIFKLQVLEGEGMGQHCLWKLEASLYLGSDMSFGDPPGDIISRAEDSPLGKP